MSDLDLLVAGGTIIDGTGAPGRAADLGIRDGRIVLRGLGEMSAGRTIDAGGLVVAPGFVDVHTHYDAQLMWDPAASPSPLHGVTTVIGGNCGFSLAPTSPPHTDYLTRMMSRVEGMPLDALEAGLDWGWRTFGEWLDRFEGRIGVNAGFLVGHSAVRRAAMGDDALDREATSGEIDAMAALVHEALGDGGLGFSTSQAHTHHDGEGRPVPSRAAAHDEILALARCCRDHPGTSLEMILPGCLGQLSDEEADLLADVSLAGQRPVNWNVLNVLAAKPELHAHQLGVSRRAAERGARVVALALPHNPGVRLSFRTGAVLQGLPGWAELFRLAPADRMIHLGDPDTRARLAEGARSKEAGVLRMLTNWDDVEICETFAPANASLEGLTVAEAAARSGGDPFDVLCDVVVADGLTTGLRPRSRDSDADWSARAEVCRDGDVVVGGSDAGAHLDMMCGAVYTTTLLAEMVRGRDLMTLEEAVHLLTDVPARLMGLRDRGRLVEGAAADVVLFDPASVSPGDERTVSDLPGGAPRLYAEAVGIPYVLVGGVDVVADGRLTGATPGTVLHSGRDTHTPLLPPPQGV